MDISKFHTKQLLNMLQKTRVLQTEVLRFDIQGQIILPKDTITKVWDRITVEELKEELAKRPHVPNKKEKKQMRQEKAKNQRNR